MNVINLLKKKDGSSYNEDEVKAVAEMDSQKPTPHWNSEAYAPFVSELKNNAEQSLTSLEREWRDIEGKLQGENNSAKEYASNSTEEFTKGEAALKKIEKEYTDDRGEEPPIGHKHSKLPYLVAMVVLSLIEIPINIPAFQIFGENQVITVITALGAGILLMLAAHILGAHLRQGGLLKDKKRLLFSVVLVAIPAVMILLIGFTRESYLASMGDIDSAQGLQVSWMALTVLNYVVYAVGIALSFYYNDALLARVMQARKACDQLKKAELKAKKDAHTAKYACESKQHEYAATAAELVQYAETLKNHYERVNLHHRNDVPEDIAGQDADTIQYMPKSFLKKIDVYIPPSLKRKTSDTEDVGE